MYIEIIMVLKDIKGLLPAVVRMARKNNDRDAIVDFILGKYLGATGSVSSMGMHMDYVILRRGLEIDYSWENEGKVTVTIEPWDEVYEAILCYEEGGLFLT